MLAAAALALAGCGDKVAESATAREIGAAPKQTLERAEERLEKALERGTERLRNEPK
jgi:hypothetical protein